MTEKPSEGSRETFVELAVLGKRIELCQIEILKLNEKVAIARKQIEELEKAEPSGNAMRLARSLFNTLTEMQAADSLVFHTMKIMYAQLTADVHED